jgi:hypothetical protein
VFVCVFLYSCVCLCVRMCAFVFVCVFLYSCVCLCVRMCAFVFVCVFLCSCVCFCVRVCVFVFLIRSKRRPRVDSVTGFVSGGNKTDHKRH